MEQLDAGGFSRSRDQEISRILERRPDRSCQAGRARRSARSIMATTL
jgi:hypothetical protein